MEKFWLDDIEIFYTPEEKKSILQLAVEHGIFIDAPCGGNHTCGKCKVELHYRKNENNSANEVLGNGVVLACETYPTSGVKVRTLSELKCNIEHDTCISNIETLDLSDKNIGIAVDIGTTTIVIYLCNLGSQKIFDVRTAVNSQRQFGADVISRLQYSAEHSHRILQEAVICDINKMIFSSAEQFNFNTSQIRKYVLAGNTVMEHFVGGLDPASISTVPYEPMSLFGIEERAVDLGLVGKRAKAYLCPCVSGFVGGDITSGLLETEIYAMPQNVLFLDVGTNGEIVLKADGKLYACSTAAGPAFEGARIECGMCGESGAISQVTADGITTIDNMPARGICGSGLIDVIAVSLDNGQIDKTGGITDSDRIIITDSVYITQKDVREVQLAKSAICAGILTLMNEAQIDVSQIDSVFLAGGFGTKINPASACRIGLIPSELIGKIQAVGNSAGRGAARILFDEEEQERVQEIADKCNYIEISENSFFSEEYINQMSFD